MEKDEIIKRMSKLETDVAGTTTFFLKAMDESIDMEKRKLFANQYIENLRVLIGLNEYPIENLELYLEGVQYIGELTG